MGLRDWMRRLGGVPDPRGADLLEEKSRALGLLIVYIAHGYPDHLWSPLTDSAPDNCAGFLEEHQI